MLQGHPPTPTPTILASKDAAAEDRHTKAKAVNVSTSSCPVPAPFHPPEQGRGTSGPGNTAAGCDSGHAILQRPVPPTVRRTGAGHGACSNKGELHTWGSDPSRSPQCIVVHHPVLVAHIALVANNLHPLGVLIHHLTRGGGPLLAQAPHVQVFVFHCQPLCLEACSGKSSMSCAKTRPHVTSGYSTASQHHATQLSTAHSPPKPCRMTKKCKETKSPCHVCVGQAVSRVLRGSPFPTVPSPSERITQGTALLPSIW